MTTQPQQHRKTRRRKRDPRPAHEPPVRERRRWPLTPIEEYIEEQKRKELERPYDDDLPF